MTQQVSSMLKQQEHRTASVTLTRTIHMTLTHKLITCWSMIHEIVQQRKNITENWSATSLTTSIWFK